MIDEKKLIEEIENSLNDNPHKDGSIAMNHIYEHHHFIHLVNKQPKIGEWIMCSDRLPVGEEYEIYDKEEDMIMHKHVLAYTNNSDIRQCVAYYDTDCWFCAVTNYPIKVIKWMDLPREESE